MKRFFFFILFYTLFASLKADVFFKHLGKSDGLSQVSVMSICQDEIGRMWFGTLEGLNCYDGNKIEVHKPTSSKAENIFGNEIYAIVTDNKGNLFLRADNSLARYNLYKEQVSILEDAIGALYEHNNDIFFTRNDSVFKWNPQAEKFDFFYNLPCKRTITSFCIERNGSIWIGTVKGLYKVDLGQEANPVCVIPDIFVFSLFNDSKSRLWVATYRKGMYMIQHEVDKSYSIESNFALSNQDIRCFIEDDEGGIWIGTSEGLNKIDSTGHVDVFLKNMTPGGLSANSIFSLYKDKQGTVWAGTYYGGINYTNPKLDIFKHYSERLNSSSGLNCSFVGNMVEDKRGNMWICTEGGGLNFFDRQKKEFSYFLTHIASGLSYPILKCLAYDEESDCLYVGTHKQGLLCFDINKKSLVMRTEEFGLSLQEIKKYGDKLYFISDKGLYERDIKTGETSSLFSSIPEVLLPSTSLLVDSKSYIWIAQYNQILRINMRDPKEVHVYKYGEKGLGKYHVLKMVEYADGAVFLGTRGSGLYKFDEQKDCFENCNQVSSRYCYNLITGENGCLVICNEKGVLMYNPTTEERIIIDEIQQLHLESLNDGCGLYICQDGEIYVGGISGMTSFYGNRVHDSFSTYGLYFSSLSVNDQFVTYENSGHIVSKSFPFEKSIHLNYNENNLYLTVAASTYIENANRKIYEYKLDGYSDKWSTTYNNDVVYTNLNPGTYTLYVREKQQVMNEPVHSIALDIVIHEPWWNTVWAYLVYLLVLAGILYFILRSWKARVRLRSSLLREKQEKEKNEQLTQLKLQFFSNISHEFRTPLTLIMSQLETLLNAGNCSPFVQNKLQHIYNSTFYFKDLISELLDFRKVESNKFHLNISNRDIIIFLENVLNDFCSQAKMQGVSLELYSNIEACQCWFDNYQLRKVFNNLLSNALKHISVNGTIILSLTEEDDNVVIRVIDNGSGIPAESLPHIFDCFYQVNEKSSIAGSGIGLALTRDLVKLHHGSISVVSAMEYGTIFTVVMPKENQFTEADSITYVDDNCNECADINRLPVETFVSDYRCEEDDEIENNEDKFTILVVEDNDDLITLLTSLLTPYYHVIVAKDGKEGLEKTLSERPDLVLSDVMMPRMTGTKMCSKIKSNFDICHIPVVLLTALGTDHSKLEGIQCGADEYIEKPFSNKLLLARIVNIIRNRQMIRQKYGQIAEKEETKEVLTTNLNSMDKKFIDDLQEVVDKHITDADFDVNELAKELCISRSSLYNKLKALCSVTPNEYIMVFRLKKAASMLRTDLGCSITDVAYETGFNSLRHFRQCFKSYFNQTPQDYRKDQTASNEDK